MGLLDSFKYRGKYSARKLTVFIAFTLLSIGFICDLAYDKTVDTTLVIVYAVIVLVGLGYLTAQNIVDILKRDSNIYSDDIDIYNRRKDGEVPME